MNLPNDSYSLFCLENVLDSETANESKLFPMLEKLTLNYGITNVYRNFDGMESFENALETFFFF